MKNMKRLASLLLALVMVLAMTATAFAEGGETDNTSSDPHGPVTGDVDNTRGSITLTTYNAEATYRIYRLLVLESYNRGEQNDNGSVGLYDYNFDPKWADFFAPNAPGYEYIRTSSTGNLTWQKDDTAENKKAFIDAALAWIEDHPTIEPTRVTTKPGDIKVNGDGTATFEDLDLGYYLVDTSVGALCGLTTTNSNAYVQPKNTIPEVNKMVKKEEDSSFAAANTAEIYDVLNFQVEVDITPGAQNFVLHDTMHEGLTFDPTSVVLTVTSTAGSTEYKEESGMFTVSQGSCSKNRSCTFEIAFTDAFHALLREGNTVTATYNATLNEKAIIGSTGNTNKVELEYGEGHFTTESTTVTHTYGFDLVKTAGQGITLLDGAIFELYEEVANPDGEGTIKVLVKLMPMGNVVINGQTYNRYRRATPADETSNPTDIVTSFEADGGLVRIDGLDKGTFYLKEIEAPAGYNILTNEEKVVITNANHYGSFVSGAFTPNTGVHVINNSGSMLPETGGIGTTIFYVGGGILFAAAVVLLITKRRMSAE